MAMQQSYARKSVGDLRGRSRWTGTGRGRASRMNLRRPSCGMASPSSATFAPAPRRAPWTGTRCCKSSSISSATQSTRLDEVRAPATSQITDFASELRGAAHRAPSRSPTMAAGSPPENLTRIFSATALPRGTTGTASACTAARSRAKEMGGAPHRRHSRGPRPRRHLHARTARRRAVRIAGL